MSKVQAFLERLLMIIPGYRWMRRIEDRIELVRTELRHAVKSEYEEVNRRIDGLSQAVERQSKALSRHDDTAKTMLVGLEGQGVKIKEGIKSLSMESRAERMTVDCVQAKVDGVQAKVDDVRTKVAGVQDKVDAVQARVSEVQTAFGDVRMLVEDVKMGVKAAAEHAVLEVENIRRTADSIVDGMSEIRRHSEAVENLVERVRIEGHEERVITAANYEKFQRQLRAQATFESGRIVNDLFRNEIRCRWQVVDALDPLLFPHKIVAKCPICGHSAAKGTYETKVSECIFGGGRLERYVCPECGAIFGPLKMMALSDTQLAEEYKQSYSVYSESDCTMLEKMAFEALHPEKGKKYLNYGAGAWNRTTKDLRAEGYDVYDFEPYAPAESNPWVIRSIDELRKQKFDGIFSNDLIEHLRNPVEDLKAMKKLLKPGAGMVHCSGCYEYAFEYTRFHLFFLTGGSLERLCEETGLVGELSDRLFDYSPARICVFRRRDGRRE